MILQDVAYQPILCTNVLKPTLICLYGSCPKQVQNHMRKLNRWTGRDAVYNGSKIFEQVFCLRNCFIEFKT